MTLCRQFIESAPLCVMHYMNLLLLFYYYLYFLQYMLIAVNSTFLERFFIVKDQTSCICGGFLTNICFTVPLQWHIAACLLQGRTHAFSRMKCFVT